MGIMRWVAKQVRLKKGLYYGALIFYSALTVILALGEIVTYSDFSSVGVPWVKWELEWFWHILWAVMILSTIIVWFYYSPIVCDTIDRLHDAFRGENYESLYERYSGWMQQFNWKMGGRSPYFKRIYLFFWMLFFGAFIFFAWSAFNWCGFCLALWGIFVIMSGSVIILNFSSYYICIVFVYFLMRICKLEREEKLDYIKQYPSSTYGFQALSHVFDTLVLYFLLDSLFCSITYFSFWQIISTKGYTPEAGIEYWIFLYVTLFLVVFGLASWMFIILVSRTYLHRLHNHWKLRSYKEYEEMYRQARPESGEMDHILADIERLNQDKLTTRSWEMLISLLAIVANLATAVSIFSDWPQFPG